MHILVPRPVPAAKAGGGHLLRMARDRFLKEAATPITSVVRLPVSVPISCTLFPSPSPNVLVAIGSERSEHYRMDPPVVELS